MIHENMPPDEMLREMERDITHAFYHLKKSYGGAQRMKVAMQQLEQRSLLLREGEELLGNVDAYTSGFTGNQWVVYAYARNVGYQTSISNSRAFVWWDTDDGSIAAATLSAAVPGMYPRSIMLFSGHFFKRYAEREHLGDVDLQLVCSFMLQQSARLIKADEKPHSPGRHRFDVIFNNGIGRGYTIGFTPSEHHTFISSVRTYLPTSMLNKTQREDTVAGREEHARIMHPQDSIVNAYMDKMPRDDFALMCTNIFLARGKDASFGGWFCSFITLFFDYACNRYLCLHQDISADEKRRLVIDTYHKYSSSIFKYLSTCRSVTSVSFLKMGLMADPYFDVKSALSFYIIYGACRDGWTREEAVRICSNTIGLLQHRLETVTLANVDSLFSHVEKLFFRKTNEY